jgi:flagellar basal-body rod protein FlgC
MADDALFRGMEISASGLHAEWVRMQVLANNMANAETTETPEGGPYRRQNVVFSTLMNELSGVTVRGITKSAGPPKLVYDPSHPSADEQGFVAMPDVKLPMEMLDLMTATRAYEANLACMRRFRQICEEAIKLLR